MSGFGRAGAERRVPRTEKEADMANSERDGSDARDGSLGLFARIRSSCAEVTRRAGSVRIDAEGLQVFAERLASESGQEDLDPASDFEGSEAETLAFVITLDAINFGSGWFPMLRKRSGMSGYRSIAAACRARFESEGCPSGAALRRMTPQTVGEWLSQDPHEPDVAELMDLYARAWRDLGYWLATRHDDRFESVIESANHSAARLVRSLAQMPLYQDVSVYEDVEVPFYKRAQITAADLNRAFASKPFGRFDDLDQLTLFADNLVPHVLRCAGVLVYDGALSDRIEIGERLMVGSREEIEIRAVAVEAVERIVKSLSALGHQTTAYALDGRLWNAGQAQEIKARPRHRARTSYY